MIKKLLLIIFVVFWLLMLCAFSDNFIEDILQFFISLIILQLMCSFRNKKTGRISTTSESKFDESNKPKKADKSSKNEYKVTSYFVGDKNIKESILKLAENKALKTMGLKK